MKEPSLSRLTFADSGVYVCEASTTGLVRRSSFRLIVEGQQAVLPPASWTRLYPGDAVSGRPQRLGR